MEGSRSREEVLHNRHLVAARNGAAWDEFNVSSLLPGEPVELIPHSIAVLLQSAFELCSATGLKTEVSMLITGIKSRPIYDQLLPIGRAKRHVIAAQGSGGEAALRLIADLNEQRQNVELLYSQESFSGRNYSDQLKQSGVTWVRKFNKNSELIEALSGLLTNASIGTVLYLSGSETFIGCAMQVASAYDLKRDEVLREHCGTFARRVQCIHCNEFNDNITRRVFRCNSCGEMLIVRDHYSRTWAAFMGVKADAETPGTFPPDEELDT